MAWRILLIDDDEVDRMSVRRLLSAAAPPPAIFESDSGEAALEEAAGRVGSAGRTLAVCFPHGNDTLHPWQRERAAR